MDMFDNFYLEQLRQNQEKITYQERRKRRKIALNTQKKQLMIPQFDLESLVLNSFQNKVETIKLNTREHDAKLKLLDLSCMETLFANSLGHNEPKDFISNSGKKLSAFILKNYDATNAKLPSLLSELQKKKRLGLVDFLYFQPRHLIQVNSLLEQLFWTGIDVSEFLNQDYSIVCCFQSLVIGCGLCTKEGYLSYLGVLPGWENVGICSFMLYWICKLNMRDITLHCSTKNRAMILYQKFGFKQEELILNFYDKYITSECKDAFFLRLRQ